MKMAWEEDFAACAEAGGLDYGDLLNRIMGLGRQYAKSLPR